MTIKSFSEKILLKTRRDVLRVHLYTRLIEKGIRPFENDIDIIIELYMFGGYRTSEEQEKFINLCIEKKYRKSKQSVRNTLSAYVNLGVFKKPRNKMLYMNEDFIPSVECDRLLLQHIVAHAE